MTRTEKIQQAIRNIQTQGRILPFKQNKPSQKAWNAMVAMFSAEDAAIVVATLAERGDRLGEKCDWVVNAIVKAVKQAASTVTESGFSGGDGYTVTNAVPASELWLAINSSDVEAPANEAPVTEIAVIDQDAAIEAVEGEIEAVEAQLEQWAEEMDANGEDFRQSYFNLQNHLAILRDRHAGLIQYKA